MIMVRKSGWYVNSYNYFWGGNFAVSISRMITIHIWVFFQEITKNFTLHFNNDIMMMRMFFFFFIYNYNNTNNYARVVGINSRKYDIHWYIKCSHYDFRFAANYNIDLPLRYIKLKVLKGTEHTHFNLKNILFNKINKQQRPGIMFVKVSENSTS